MISDITPKLMQQDSLYAAGHVAAHAVLLDERLGGAVPEDLLGVLERHHLPDMPFGPEGIARRLAAVQHALGHGLDHPADDGHAEGVVHARPGLNAVDLADRDLLEVGVLLEQEGAEVVLLGDLVRIVGGVQIPLAAGAVLHAVVAHGLS